MNKDEVLNGLPSFVTSPFLLELYVSSVGVTGARASVSDRVQTLLRDIKEVCLYS
jgi:tryptophan synthase alpha subunit